MSRTVQTPRRVQRESRAAALSRGFTLIELLVTLAIIALSTTAVGVSLSALEPRPEAEIPRRVSEARTTAIRIGTEVTLDFTAGVRVTVRPDGSATPARVCDGAACWRVDPWTGEARRE